MLSLNKKQSNDRYLRKVYPVNPNLPGAPTVENLRKLKDPFPKVKFNKFSKKHALYLKGVWAKSLNLLKGDLREVLDRVVKKNDKELETEHTKVRYDRAWEIRKAHESDSSQVQKQACDKILKHMVINGRAFKKDAFEEKYKDADAKKSKRVKKSREKLKELDKPKKHKKPRHK